MNRYKIIATYKGVDIEICDTTSEVWRDNILAALRERTWWKDGVVAMITFKSEQNKSFTHSPITDLTIDKILNSIHKK